MQSYTTVNSSIPVTVKGLSPVTVCEWNRIMAEYGSPVFCSTKEDTLMGFFYALEEALDSGFPPNIWKVQADISFFIMKNRKNKL